MYAFFGFFVLGLTFRYALWLMVLSSLGVNGAGVAECDLEGLSIAYGDTSVVKNVTLSVKKGESFALVGESGSGKSTILKAIAGQENHWTGRIKLGEHSLEHRRDQSLVRLCQMVFQDPYGSIYCGPRNQDNGLR